ncbi:MAG: MFS transporter [Candidatus Kariarchaeaceae archaeon]|jgi:MFS family permease
MSSSFFGILREKGILTTSIVSSLLFASSALGVQRTALSLYTKELSGSLQNYVIASAAISLAIFGASKAVGNFLGGRLADTKGRAFISRIGLVILGLGSFILALANNLAQFFIGNSIVGMGIGLLFASSAIALADIATPMHRAKGLSLMELSVYAGTSIGAIIAGNVAETWDFEATFIVALIIVMFSLVWGIGLRDTRSIISTEETSRFLTAKEKLAILNEQWIEHHKDDSNSDILEVFTPFLNKSDEVSPAVRRFSWRLFFRPSVLVTLSTGIVTRISDAAMILVYPLLIYLYYHSPVKLGIATSIFTIFWSIGIVIAGPFSDSVGRKIPLAFGLFLEALGMVIMFLLGLNEWFPIIIFGTMVAGLGRGIYFPIPPSAATDFVSPRHRGLTLGIYRFVLDFGYVIGALLLIVLIEPRADGACIDSGIDDDCKTLLQPTMIIILIILVIQGLLVILFLKDPRPGFKQFPQVEEHLELIDKTIQNVSKGIYQYTESNTTNAEENLFIAKSFEREADNVLEFMTRATYSGMWRAADALEILQFSAKVDKAAGHTLRAFRKLLLVDHILPNNFMIKLRQYAVILEILMETTFETFKLIQVRLNLAVKQSYQVNFVEEFLDDIHRQLWQEIIHMTDEVSPLCLLLLSQAIDSLEKGANTLEDAAELIRLISFKH